LVSGAVGLVLECLDDSAKQSAQNGQELRSHGKVHLPVGEDSEQGTEKRANPVDPVVAREMAVDDGGTERASWVDTGCVKRRVNKCRPGSRPF
jgi:hypothetical protein